MEYWKARIAFKGHVEKAQGMRGDGAAEQAPSLVEVRAKQRHVGATGG